MDAESYRFSVNDRVPGRPDVQLGEYAKSQ
jgi:hypothetical protein